MSKALSGLQSFLTKLVPDLLLSKKICLKAHFQKISPNLYGKTRILNSCKSYNVNWPTDLIKTDLISKNNLNIPLPESTSCSLAASYPFSLIKLLPSPHLKCYPSTNLHPNSFVPHLSSEIHF